MFSNEFDSNKYDSNKFGWKFGPIIIDSQFFSTICSAVAILFGNIHSVCTRSVEIASDSNEKFTVKIGKKMKNKFLAIFKKQSVETTENTEKEDTKITENTTFTEKIETTENTAISENLDTDNKKSE